MTPLQESLVIDNMHLVRQLSYKVTGIHRFADRQELISAGYLALVKAAINFQGRSQFTTYMYKAVLGAMYSCLSDEAYNDVKRMKLFSIDALLNTPANAYSELGRLSKVLAERISVNPSHAAMVKATKTKLYECLPLLRTDYQYILKRKVLDEATDKEIALEVMLTPMAVAKKFIRAKRDLKTLFEGGSVRTKVYAVRSRSKELKKAELVYCECGCGTLIPEKGLNGKVRRFVSGHHHRILNHSTKGLENTQVIFEGKKKCSLCKEIKVEEEFGIDRRKSTGRASKCKLCSRIADKNQRKNKKLSQMLEYRNKLDNS